MYTQDEQNSGEQLALAIGQALVSARENSGLSVQDVAERTRISAAHLSALEAGQFERLPGVGYIPGFIRNYCQAVGIDATPHIDSLKSLSSAVTKKPEYSFPVQALVPRVAGSMIAMFAVLVGLAVYVGWTFISYNQTDEPELIASSISPVDQPDLGLDTAPVIPDSPAQPDEQTVSETAPAADVEPVEPVAPAAPRTDEAVSVADLAPQPDTATAVTPSQQTLTTPQADVHIHRVDNDAIVEDLPLGQISNYEWEMEPFGGFTTELDVINALKTGNLYLNVHSDKYTAGEIEGTFIESTGSTTLQVPDPPPAITNLPPDLLEMDIARFEDQGLPVAVDNGFCEGFENANPDVDFSRDLLFLAGVRFRRFLRGLFDGGKRRGRWSKFHRRSVFFTFGFGGNVRNRFRR